ncbi:MAG: ferric reductase-like transmembrane domain-containing protein [Thermodesulfobacteriota bacterium]
MTPAAIALGRPLAPGWRLLLGGLVLILLALLLAGALSIPWLFPSKTLWYRFGLDRLLLRGGKMLGLAAACLLLLQPLLAARLHLLDRLAGLPWLFRRHRHGGLLLALLALGHPFLVLDLGTLGTLRLTAKLWPEALGLLLLTSILVMAAVARWRLAWGLAFHRWWPLHRLGAVAVLALLFGHVLTVSDSFAAGPPRLAALAALATVVPVLAGSWLRRLGRRPCRVRAVTPAGPDTCTIELVPEGRRTFAYLPGQFAFLSCQSRAVSAEEHPFTIASSPLRPACLLFTIRACGDWTRTVPKLAAGERVALEGPFGRFSHLVYLQARELVMIAGGIGITPMLAMLRHLADTGDRRPITLVWSVRRREDLLFPEEWPRLGQRLPGFRFLPHHSRPQPGAAEPGRRLDRAILAQHLAPCHREAEVFLCGPPAMMAEVRGILAGLGFARRHIHDEAFSL